MALTSISYLIVSIPAMIYKGSSYNKQTTMEQTPALVGVLICSIAFIGYAIYQTKSSNAHVQQEMAHAKLQFQQWQNRIGKTFGNASTAMRTVFDKFDKDGNGTIDRNELAHGFAALGLNCTRQQIFEIMDSMNVDNDINTLTFEEFSEAFKQWSRVLITHEYKPNINNIRYSDPIGLNVQQENIQSNRHSLDIPRNFPKSADNLTVVRKRSKVF